MEVGSQESEDETSNQNTPLDDAIIERAAAALFQLCPLPKARLGVSSVVSTAKSVGVDIPEHVAEYLGDRAMRELRHAILDGSADITIVFDTRDTGIYWDLAVFSNIRGKKFVKSLALNRNIFQDFRINQCYLEMLKRDSGINDNMTSGFVPEIATQFNRHERAPGLRSSDFTKALKFMNWFDSENSEDPQRRLSQDEIPESAATSIPLIYLHRFPPEELEDVEGASSSMVVEQTKTEEEGSWQDYTSNTTVSSGDKESPGNSSGGSVSYGGSANSEQQYDAADSNDRENQLDNNDRDTHEISLGLS